VTCSSETLAEKALSLARGLRENGIGRGTAVALWAPNSPVWIATALGVLASGGMLVPIDDLADAEQLEAALISSGARLILTTARHLDASGAILDPAACSPPTAKRGNRHGTNCYLPQPLENKPNDRDIG
jgi:long-subunit acyl-CoA synthetase (AMP-forming)